MNQLELLHNNGEKIKWCDWWQNVQEFLIKLNQHLPYNPSVPTNLPKRNQNWCPYEDLNTNVHKSCTYNSPKLEVTQTLIREVTQIYSYSGMLLTLNGWTAGRCRMWVNLKNTILSKKSQSKWVCTILFHLYETLEKTNI